MKRTKKLVLKVDNLKHLSDHGLAVEFADEQLKELVNSLKKDGITDLEAGQSSLCLVTVGRVTFTKLFLARGSYTIHKVHYLDEAAGLKFTHAKSSNEEAFETLRAVILKGSLPSIWRTRTGAGQDTLREWVKQWGWTLTGESGLRAMAVKKAKEQISAQISAIEYNIRSNSADLARFNSRDFRAEINREREQALKNIKFFRKSQDDSDVLYEKLAKIPAEREPVSNEVNSTSIFYNFGIRQSYDRQDDGKCIPRYQLPGAARSVSHPVIRPNYTVSLEEDGESIRLSSGIKCDVTLSQFIRWMKGETTAPRTTYGHFSVVEGATESLQPIKLIRCGCHLVDPSNLSEEVRELMKPSHTVTVSEGTKTLYWPEDRDAILERGKEKVNATKEMFRNRIASSVTEYRRTVATIRDYEEHKEEHIQKFKDKGAALEKELEEAKVKLAEAYIKFITDSNPKDIVLAAVNALAGIKAE